MSLVTERSPECETLVLVWAAYWESMPGPGCSYSFLYIQLIIFADERTDINTPFAVCLLALENLTFFK